MTLPEVSFSTEDVEAGVQALIVNEFIDLDREDMVEIVRLVLTHATTGMRQEAYRAGRGAAAEPGGGMKRCSGP